MDSYDDDDESDLCEWLKELLEVRERCVGGSENTWAITEVVVALDAEVFDRNGVFKLPCLDPPTHILADAVLETTALVIRLYHTVDDDD